MVHASFVPYSASNPSRWAMSDCEALVAAVEEARRILDLYDGAGPRRNQDELLAMLQFILCDPSVSRAVALLKNRQRLSLTK